MTVFPTRSREKDGLGKEDVIGRERREKRTVTPFPSTKAWGSEVFRVIKEGITELENCRAL